MSQTAGGPALFIGDDTAYVALVRPELDPADPDIREAAAAAGVTPEEFVGPGTIWALMSEDANGEGDGFELPGLRDIEADDFAGQLAAGLAGSEAFTLEAGSVLRLDARPADGDSWAVSAEVTPPEGHDGQGPQSLDLGRLVSAALLSDLEEFRRSLA
ncbi:hypothetical protein OHS33_15890 [Streptomyces sp. NBC_00536]|uniref:hypothetical protein n=1 Tax=Streptomyces sp. NBC_00536 TaxID=2975769 RepID=UPI002E80CBF5|nr:hypothetical protein [Streptomyces sp. NBC_00536]WUC79679.1 hypothetical protein OHS33_15890 [Streptomyces sp. NBC_00536]